MCESSRPRTAISPQEVAEHRFREDLYLSHQRHVARPAAAASASRRHSAARRITFLGTGWHIAPDALRVLETYNWPGNIRQLINVIERAKILANDCFITTDELPGTVMNSLSVNQISRTADSLTTMIPTVPAEDGTLASIEKARVVEVMQKQKGNKSRAAQMLGISRRSLYRLLEKYNLDGGN